MQLQYWHCDVALEREMKLDSQAVQQIIVIIIIKCF